MPETPEVATTAAVVPPTVPPVAIPPISSPAAEVRPADRAPVVEFFRVAGIVSRAFQHAEVVAKADILKVINEIRFAEFVNTGHIESVPA